MKLEFRASTIAAMLGLFGSLLGGQAQANDVEYVNYSNYAEKLEAQDARIAELEARLDAQQGTAGGCNDCGVCDDCLDNTCCRSGFVAGGELVFLKPFSITDGLGGTFGYDTGFRGWIGWQWAGGLGARIRGFDYEQTAGTNAIDISYFDFEIFDSWEMSPRWNLELGGGIRQLDFSESSLFGLFATGVHGVGPMLSGQLTRYVTDKVSLYASARDAIIVGNQAGPLDGDATCNVLELQLGAQYNRDWNGALLFGRIGWEAQVYQGLVGLVDQDSTLMGGVLSAGIMR